MACRVNVDTAEVAGVRLLAENDKVVSLHRRDGFFEPKSMKLWQSLAAKGGLLLDVGAYTGVYAISAALAGAEVVAFEPNEEAVERLRCNRAINGAAFDIFPVALWSSASVLAFRAAPNLSTAGSVMANGERTATVVGMPLDAFRFANVTAIKIDAERSEPQVLKGAWKTITRCRPQILTEVLDAERDAAIAEILAPHGYRRAPVERNMVQWLP